MAHSESINELAAALSKAQGEMQAAIKDKVNPFFKSSYADLGSVWDAARPVLSKYGLSVLQTTEMAPEGKIVMVTTLAHSSGQWVKSFLPLNPAKNDNQGIGASITYLRRYSLSAIVGVVCDDDDDGETAVGRGKAKHQPEMQPKANENVGKAEIDTLDKLLDKLDEETEKSFFSWIFKTYEAERLNQIPMSAYEKCVNHINTKIKFLNDKNKQNQQAAVA